MIHKNYRVLATCSFVKIVIVKHEKDEKTPQNFTNLKAWHLTMVVSSYWGGDCWNYAREALTEKVFDKTEVGDFDNARTADTKFHEQV